jgi:hypothetical protein
LKHGPQHGDCSKALPPGETDNSQSHACRCSRPNASGIASFNPAFDHGQVVAGSNLDHHRYRFSFSTIREIIQIRPIGIVPHGEIGGSNLFKVLEVSRPQKSANTADRITDIIAKALCGYLFKNACYNESARCS